MEDQSEATPQPCRLLELPAELRLRIYSFALAPTGRLYLHRTPNKRRAVTPAISPALLATNRQIHAEAAGVLYTENTVHIALDAHDTTWPAIDEARLPQRVLQKLEHLCVLLDCTAALWRGYGAVDFEAFTALTALRSLRVRALVLPDWDESEEDEEADGDEGGAAAAVPAPAGETEPSEPTWKFPGFSRLAPEILERVPASTRIYYGPDLVPDGSEGVMDHLATSTSGALAPFDEFYTPKFKLSTMPGQRHDAEAREVSTEDLQAGAEAAHLEGGRGCKAGTVKDVWGEYRELFLGRMATRI